MAWDLATAKRAAQKRGLTPGPEWASHPDDWYMAWFQGGIDAGDPSILKDAGLYQAAEESEQGYNRDYMQSAPSSEWLGKRKPTPSELRRYAQESRQSEDYARYSDAQLAAWIGKSWDPGQGAFFNDFGDRVEKPTESGPASTAAGYPTGAKGVGGGGGRGGGGGGGGGGAETVAAPASPAVDPTTTPEWLLNSPLAQMLANQGGFLRQYDQRPGDRMPGVGGGVMGGGSIWWAPTPGGGLGRPENLNRPLRGGPGPSMSLGPDGRAGGGDWNRPVGGGPVPAPGLTSTGMGLTPGVSGGRGTVGDWNRPGSSPLTNAMTPLQAAAPRGVASAFNPYSGSALSGTMSMLGGGTLPTTDPLTGLLTKYNKKRPGGWF